MEQSEVTMEILEAVTIELQCAMCGGQYEISLKQILLSQNMLHEGCPVEDQRECPPLFHADLADRELILNLQHAWLELEEKTRAGGRKLLLQRGQDKE